MALRADPLRIAIVTWSSRRVGGVEDYLAMLVPALHRAGLAVAFWHEVDTPADRCRINIPPAVRDICAADVGLETSIQQLRDWKPHVLYVHGLQDVEAEAKLLDIAPAVFFIHTYTGTCISGAKAFSRPVMVPCGRTFGPACLVHYFPHGCGGSDPRTMWRLFRLQSRRLRLFPRYAAVLTNSDHMRNEMEKHGVRAFVVPYPTETSAGDASPFVTSTWRLLYAGRMEALKGGHYLIDALPEIVRAARRPVRLVLAGDGRDRQKWEAAAARVQSTTPNVTIEFAGWVTQDQVGALMRDADLLVVPSLWPEPLGSVGPAAAQYGLPAAAFATGGIPEWLVDGVSGHLAPSDPPTPSGLARAVIQCLKDPVHYAALRRGTRDVATRFTMARHLPIVTRHLDRR